MFRNAEKDEIEMGVVSTDMDVGSGKAADESWQVEIGDIFGYLRDYVRKLRALIKAYFAVLAVVFSFFLLQYSLGTPTYTAAAMIGPPNPSPTASMLSTMGGGLGGRGGLMQRLSGGAGGEGNTPFQEYQQLLTVPQLPIELAAHDDFLRKVFPKQWDDKAGTWRAHGPLHAVKAAVFRVLKRPVADHPNIEMLAAYLDKHLDIDQAKVIGSGRKGGVAALAGLGSGYYTLSFTSDDPRKAEQMLNTILHRADEIIRRQQLRDVNARISFIETELPRITQTEQRNTLIETLANQEQLKVMLVADQRFAFVMVSEPYAKETPTSPVAPSKAIVLSVFLSLVLWMAAVLFEAKIPFVHRLLKRFAKSESKLVAV